MTDENIKLIDEEIKAQVKELSGLTPGSKEHTAAVEAVVKIMKIDSDNYKNQMEADEKFYRRELDTKIHEADMELKRKELDAREQALNAERRKTLITSAVTIGTTLVTSAVTTAGIVISVKNHKASIEAKQSMLEQVLLFEKDGIVSSIAAKNTINEINKL